MNSTDMGSAGLASTDGLSHIWRKRAITLHGALMPLLLVLREGQPKISFEDLYPLPVLENMAWFGDQVEGIEAYAGPLRAYLSGLPEYSAHKPSKPHIASPALAGRAANGRGRQAILDQHEMIVVSHRQFVLSVLSVSVH